MSNLTADKIKGATAEITDIFELGTVLHDDVALTVLAALRECEKREKGCEYCTSRFDIATHQTNEAGLQAGTKKKADYCPMCGRKLERSDT